MGAKQADKLILSQVSERTRHVLECKQQDVLSLEQKLSRFLDHYFSATAEAATALAEAEAKLISFRHTSQDSDEQQASFSAGADPLKQDMKRLYHAMARRCHPDQANESEIQEAQAQMQALNEAYRAQNLSALWKIRWQIERQEAEGRLSHKQRVQLLKEQCSSMQTAVEQLEARETALKSSNAYALMCHAEMIALQGGDFFARARDQIEQQTMQRKRQIAIEEMKASYAAIRAAINHAAAKPVTTHAGAA